MTNLPATTEASNVPVGLEDFDQSDRVMPTIRIDHKEGVFADGLSGETWKELTCVVLGLVKQRVLWDTDLDSKDGPLCRSYEFKLGHPSKNDKGQSIFPWDAAGFEETEDTLPCNACALKEWGSHPTRDTPWCSEQHSLIIAIPHDDGSFSPAVLQLQRSSIKNSRTYLSSFANAGKPAFEVVTRITLDKQRKGTTDFATPKFVRGDNTDTEDHPEFADTYQSIRKFLQTPWTRRSNNGDDSEVEVATPASAPASAPVSAPAAPAAADSGIGGSAPAAAPAAPVEEETEELPF